MCGGTRTYSRYFVGGHFWAFTTAILALITSAILDRIEPTIRRWKALEWPVSSIRAEFSYKALTALEQRESTKKPLVREVGVFHHVFGPLLPNRAVFLKCALIEVVLGLIAFQRRIAWPIWLSIA